MLKKLEWELYKSYECSSRPVVMRQGQQELRSSSPDLYGAHHEAAFLHRVVEGLPGIQRWVVESKYGLIPSALYELQGYLMTEYGIPVQAAQTFILHWLGRKSEAPLKNLVGVATGSKSTITRKCREACLRLDEINLKALENISIQTG